MFDDIESAVAFIEARTASKYQKHHFKDVYNKYFESNSPVPSIHIAGTNGKGSTSRMIAHMLASTPLKVGLFSSPHLIHHHERIQINQQHIPDALLLQYINELYSDIVQYSLIMFEIDFLIAMLYFRDQKVDFAIIEVGIGGLHDTTNILMPLVSVITNVSYDHQDLLGETLEAITKEKSGIIKAGVPVVSGVHQSKLREIIDSKAHQANASVTYVAAPKVSVNEHQLMYQEHDLTVKLNTEAKYQGINSKIAITVIDLLKKQYGVSIDLEDAIKSLETFSIQGRFELVSESPRLIVDGAHNVAGIKALCATTRNLKEDFVIVFSALARKDYAEMITLLKQEYQEVVFLEFNRFGAIKQADISSYNLKVFYELDSVLTYYREKHPDKTIIFCGSLYFVAEVIKGLN